MRGARPQAEPVPWRGSWPLNTLCGSLGAVCVRYLTLSPQQSTEPGGWVNGFCSLIASVPGTMCFLLPKPARSRWGAACWWMLSLPCFPRTVQAA